MHCTKFGGTERFLLELCRSQVQSGKRVVVQYEKRPESHLYRRELKRAGIELQVTKTQGKPAISLVATLRLYQSIQPAQVVTHFLSTPQLLAAAVYGFYDRSVQLVSIFHLTSGLRHFSLARFCLQRFDLIVPVSKAVTAQLQSVLSSNVALQQRYLGTFRHQRELQLLIKSRPQIRHNLKLPKEVFVVGSTLFDHPVKGLDTLLEGFSSTALKNRSMHLLVIGIEPSLPLQEKLSRLGLGEDRVTLTGIVDNAVELLPAIDLYVQPSRQEALGLALVEAASLGLPLLGSDVGGIPEVIKPGYNGELFEPGHPQQLAGKLLHLASQPELCAEYGANSRQLWAQRFDGNANLARTAAVINDAAKQRK